MFKRCRHWPCRPRFLVSGDFLTGAQSRFEGMGGAFDNEPAPRLKPSLQAAWLLPPPESPLPHACRKARRSQCRTTLPHVQGWNSCNCLYLSRLLGRCCCRLPITRYSRPLVFALPTTATLRSLRSTVTHHTFVIDTDGFVDTTSAYST